VGGTWPDPPRDVLTGNFAPGGPPAGDYTHSLAPVAPCAAVSAVVNISVVQALDAGSAGSVDFCPDGAQADLFNSLDGTPDAGGTWTAPGGGAFSGLFDPIVNIAGNYTYTVAPAAPCTPSAAGVAVTISPIADAGPDAAVCDRDHDLQAVGTWDSGEWSGPLGVAFADATAGSTTV